MALDEDVRAELARVAEKRVELEAAVQGDDALANAEVVGLIGGLVIVMADSYERVLLMLADQARH